MGYIKKFAALFSSVRPTPHNAARPLHPPQHFLSGHETRSSHEHHQHPDEFFHQKRLLDPSHVRSRHPAQAEVRRRRRMRFQPREPGSRSPARRWQGAGRIRQARGRAVQPRLHAEQRVRLGPRKARRPPFQGTGSRAHGQRRHPDLRGRGRAQRDLQDRSGTRRRSAHRDPLFRGIRLLCGQPRRYAQEGPDLAGYLRA